MDEAIGRPDDLAGVALYSPRVIAVCCFLTLPFGMILYGINVARRGNHTIGYALASSGAVLFLALMAAVVLAETTGRELSPRFGSLIGVMDLGVGVGLMYVERRHDAAALRRGATHARWWPPLVAWLAVIITAVLIVVVVSPD